MNHDFANQRMVHEASYSSQWRNLKLRYVLWACNFIFFASFVVFRDLVGVPWLRNLSFGIFAFLLINFGFIGICSRLEVPQMR